MKKTLISILSTLIIGAFLFIGYWKLPEEINRKSDIKFGNTLIEKIEDYKNITGHLPDNDDWKELEKLGFGIEELKNKPDYTTDGINYELTFLEGFDGPYLMWNSKERKWKTENPTIFRSGNISEVNQNNKQSDT